VKSVAGAFRENYWALPEVACSPFYLRKTPDALMRVTGFGVERRQAGSYQRKLRLTGQLPVCASLEMIEDIRRRARENLSRSPALSLLSRDLAADEQFQLPPDRSDYELISTERPWGPMLGYRTQFTAEFNRIRRSAIRPDWLSRLHVPNRA
jgi:hypothetical protein